MDLAPATICKALVVELIRRLWDRGLLSKFNDIAVRIHDNWLPEWIEYRTHQTMLDVDRQAEEIRAKAEAEEAIKYAPVFTESQKGETALGGPMQLSHPTLGRFDAITETDTTCEAGSPEGTGEATGEDTDARGR